MRRLGVSPTVEESEEQNWVHFSRPSDGMRMSEFISKPPENFTARIHGLEVVFNQLDNEPEYLVYLCKCKHMYQVVYVFKQPGTKLAADLQQTVYGTYFGDYQVIPLSNRLSSIQHARDVKVDWALAVFTEYFDFPYIGS